jgi:hypothetical protein
MVSFALEMENELANGANADREMIQWTFTVKTPTKNSRVTMFRNYCALVLVISIPNLNASALSRCRPTRDKIRGAKDGLSEAVACFALLRL